LVERTESWEKGELTIKVRPPGLKNCEMCSLRKGEEGEKGADATGRIDLGDPQGKSEKRKAQGNSERNQ